MSAIQPVRQQQRTNSQLHASVTPSMPAYKGYPPVCAGVHDMPCVTCGRVTYVLQRRSPDVNPGKASLCWDECESSNFQVSSMSWLTAATGVAVLSFRGRLSFGGMKDVACYSRRSRHRQQQCAAADSSSAAAADGSNAQPPTAAVQPPPTSAMRSRRQQQCSSRRRQQCNTSRRPCCLGTNHTHQSKAELSAQVAALQLTRAREEMQPAQTWGACYAYCVGIRMQLRAPSVPGPARITHVP